MLCISNASLLFNLGITSRTLNRYSDYGVLIVPNVSENPLAVFLMQLVIPTLNSPGVVKSISIPQNFYSSSLCTFKGAIYLSSLLSLIHCIKLSFTFGSIWDDLTSSTCHTIVCCFSFTVLFTTHGSYLFNLNPISFKTLTIFL